MSINIVKVRPTVTRGDMVFNPNSIVVPSSCAPLEWKDNVAAIVIRGTEEEIIQTLDNLKSDEKCAIRVPHSHFSLIPTHDEFEYDGFSFELDLYMGLGYLVTTDKAGEGFYMGTSGIAEGIVRHAVDKIKGYLLGEVSDVADALNTLYDKFQSDAPEGKKDGELVFVISYDRHDSLFNGDVYSYHSGKVTEGAKAEGITFNTKENEWLSVDIAFKTILSGMNDR